MDICSLRDTFAFCLLFPGDAKVARAGIERGSNHRTDGITDGGQVRSGIGLSRGWARRSLAKKGP
jgi:hypothetical protein